MKNVKNLLLLSAALFAVQAVNAQDEPTPEKKEKIKMIMIKKTVDEDGNETVEKIVKEGSEADKFVWVEKGEGGDEKDVKVIIKDGEEVMVEEIEIEEGDEAVEIEIEKEMEKHVVVKKGKKKINIEIEEEDGEKTVEVRNENDGEVEVKVITLGEGEELPEDIRKQLEEHGINIDDLHLDGDHDGKSKKKVKKKIRIKKEKKSYDDK